MRAATLAQFLRDEASDLYQNGLPETDRIAEVLRSLADRCDTVEEEVESR